MVTYCNVKLCKYNKNWRCQAKNLNLRDVDSKNFDDKIEDIELSPFASINVEQAMLVCMTYERNPPKPPIRKEFEGKPEKISTGEKIEWDQEFG